MKSVIEYLKRSAIKYPQKIAVIEEDKTLNYEELNNYSKCVGSFLVSVLDFKSPVAVFMDKGCDALVSFMGALYAGCFYSLVNPDLPEVRVRLIMDSLEARVIITNKSFYEAAKEIFPDKKLLLIEELLSTSIDEVALEKREREVIDLDPVYCNFTSGSTGVPKGVLVGHASVINFIDDFILKFGIDKNDIIANQAPFDFDVSVKDIYSAFAASATLLIVPKAYFSNPSKLLDYLVLNKATTLIWAVSALTLVTTFHGLDYKVPTSVKRVIFSGEVMPKKHLDIWMSKLKKALFVNVYGPTEITCNCTYHVIRRDIDYEKIPIGVPFSNKRVFLLDENDQVINDEGVVGEICVSGSCLALGYINNEEETKKHFVLNTSNKLFPEVIYRTGDLGYLENGLFYFKGRKDFQVKLMGHRIELEEIDREIEKYAGVSQSVTLFLEEKAALYTFYVGDIEDKLIREYLKNVLPVYMIPKKFIKVSEFPLTKNGKIDRKLLLESVGK